MSHMTYNLFEYYNKFIANQKERERGNASDISYLKEAAKFWTKNSLPKSKKQHKNSIIDEKSIELLLLAWWHVKNIQINY